MKMDREHDNEIALAQYDTDETHSQGHKDRESYNGEREREKDRINHFSELEMGMRCVCF